MDVQTIVFLLFILMLAIFLGFELISRVPSQLHTPLMSGSNAISGITIVGALLSLRGSSESVTIVLGTLAVACATINVVGGYLVTDRMFAMFRKKGPEKAEMSRAFLIDLAYIGAAVLFVYGLKRLQRAESARRGNQISAIGMLLAAVATVAYGGLDYQWIVVGIITGGAVGAFAARTVAMTSMPEMVALFNGSGGLASLLVGWAEYHQTQVGISTAAGGEFSIFTLGSIGVASLIGGVTFTGSIVAWGKLAGKVPGSPMLFPGQQVVSVLLVIGALAAGGVFAMVGEPSALMEAKYTAYLALVGISLVLGTLSVLSIGGGDMPVVVALLNSCSGLAACATGSLSSTKC